nr:hypothetical protein [Tanacetum cinerariifolium]
MPHQPFSGNELVEEVLQALAVAARGTQVRAVVQGQQELAVRPGVQLLDLLHIHNQRAVDA